MRASTPPWRAVVSWRCRCSAGPAASAPSLCHCRTCRWPLSVSDACCVDLLERANLPDPNTPTTLAADDAVAAAAAAAVMNALGASMPACPSSRASSLHPTWLRRRS